MKPIFREVHPDAEEQEITQQDQFNTDEVTLAETLIRESHQNSNDAAIPGKKVSIRINIKEPDPDHAGFWRPLLEQLTPNLVACDVEVSAIDFGMPRLLIIEDFGTTGLIGNTEEKDSSNFQDFWRRVGKSHKSGEKSGSWGLGKIVFPATSRIRTFFGLTIRSNDVTATPLLMGQTLLKHHKIGNTEYSPIGLFSVLNEKDFRAPVKDKIFIDKFVAASALTRESEPGLSIVIPFVHDEVDVEDLIPFIVKNYFFPILTGRLEVEVAGEKINSDTFDELATKHGGSALADGHLIQFIRDIYNSREKEPRLNLPDGWNAQNLEGSIPSEKLDEIRKLYAKRELIHIRAPMTLTPRAGQSKKGHFDLFLRHADDNVRATPLFVRGAITVPGEEQFFPSRQAFAALVATDEIVSAFLRDAENPAHTRWNGQAEKLSRNWKSAGSKLSQIRGSLRAVHDLLAQAVERTETDALLDVLSIEATGAEQTTKRDKRTKVKKMPDIKARPKLFSISKVREGFVVRAGSSLPLERLPFQIKIKIGYDLMRGDPFKKHNAFDFDLTKPGEVSVSSYGAEYSATGPNELLIDVNEPDFEVKVEGFDMRRDLKVKATR